MRISVFGLGYVGAVSAACLAADGHTVVGVDNNPVKVDLLNQGRAPVVEAGLGELIEQGVRAGRLRATTDCDEAVAGTDLGFVCVGTPSKGNGSLDLEYLRRVADDIGQAIRRRRSPIVVVVRSTVLPGTTRQVLLPDLERAAGQPVAVAVHPEFLREGTAIRDYHEPPKVVVGALDEAVRDLVAPVVARPGAPLVQTDLELAEMVKYADNAWHALKVSFANEIGSLAKAQGLDGHSVMDILCADTKLNLSPVYLRPGFAFGGSCLPKDVRALRYQGRTVKGKEIAFTPFLDDPNRPKSHDTGVDVGDQLAGFEAAQGFVRGPNGEARHLDQHVVGGLGRPPLAHRGLRRVRLARVLEPQLDVLRRVGDLTDALRQDLLGCGSARIASTCSSVSTPRRWR